MDQSSSGFFGQTWEGSQLKTPLSSCRYPDSFRRYARSKCEVAQNLTNFATVFALPNSKGGSPPKKLYPIDHACLAARHLEKFGKVPPHSPKVIGVHTPNFKQNFECSSLKIVGGPPSPMGCALGSLGHSQARVKISAGGAP